MFSVGCGVQVPATVKVGASGRCLPFAMFTRHSPPSPLPSEYSAGSSASIPMSPQFVLVLPI